MKCNGHHITFDCSGRTFYANNNIIGIDDELNTSQGYDDGLEGFGEEESLTNEERCELADHMIQRWEAYKAGRSSEST